MKQKKISAAICASLTGLSMTLAAQAQEEQTPDAASMDMEKIAVVGARGAPRTVTSSPVPVDVISADELSGVAFSDMNDVLKTLVPSYTLGRQPISDGAAFIRPASLRGLPTDKTLVLVNSKRRHRSALVQTSGSGTQGPDLSMIPTAAIGNVEVLRDGAAAQYGSDAIAGVINFQLKNNAEGGMFTAEYGQFYEGDGETLVLTGNKGFALGDDGFISISAEYSDNEATSRAKQYCTGAFCLNPDDPNFNPDADYNQYLTPEFYAAAEQMAQSVHGADVVQPWGRPNFDSTLIFINAGYAISSDMELYGFGNYSQKDGDSTFFYRYPENGTIENIRLQDGSVWSPLSIYPGGFTPRFKGEITDYSAVAGLKGMVGALGYDISARYGYDEIDYTISNTINPSMGDATPTSFSPGALSNEETQIQADFTYDFASYVFAFGLSYLDEGYDIEQGEELSYLAGDYSVADPWGFCADGTATAAGIAVIASGSSLNCADSDDPVYQIMGVGSNGFPGYSPEFSGSYDRDSYSAYIDLSGDITDSLFGQAALRYEDYSDMGSELVYKVAGFYQLTEELGLRASYGTGFRAPTPGQQGTTNVSTALPNGFPVATGLFPASSAVGQALGASLLDPETSTNVTFGLTADYGPLNVTVDYYRIALEDRFYSISTLDVSSDEQGDPQAYANYLALANANVVGAETIGAVRYFQNAFDTVTEGVDVVASYNMESDYGMTTFTASYNYNTTEFDSDPSEFLNAEDMYDFENGTPESRAILSVKHAFDDIEVVARASYYGEYTNIDSVSLIEGTSQIDFDNTASQTFSSEWFLDLEGTYHINETLSLIAGVRNLFDNYPDESAPDMAGDACCGRIYRSDSIVDWQGGYYYTKLVAKF